MTDEEKKKKENGEVAAVASPGVPFKENRSFGLPVEEKTFDGGGLLPGDGVTEAQEGEAQESAVDRLLREYGELKRNDEEERRRERSRAMVSGMGDAARAVANLYFTTRHAPDAMKEKDAVMPKLQARYEKLRAERLKDMERVRKYMDNARKQEADAATSAEKRRQFNVTMEWRRGEQRRKDAEAESNRVLTEAKARATDAMTEYRKAIAAKNEKQIAYWEAKTIYAEELTKNLERGYKLKEAESNARVAANEALANSRREGQTIIYEYDERGNLVEKTVKPAADGGTGNGGTRAQGGGQTMPGVAGGGGTTMPGVKK